MAEKIDIQQVKMGAAGHELKTATPPGPLPEREQLTPGQIVALPDIGQLQEIDGYSGWLAQAFKKVKAAVGLK